MDAAYDFVDNTGGVFYFKTDLDAPRGKIIAIDSANPARANWREIVPESSDVIDFVLAVNGQLVIVYLHDAHHRVAVHDLDGTFVRDIALPAIGSIGGLSARRDDTDFYFAFTSYLYPTSIFRYDFATDSVEPIHRPEIDFDPTPYETRQVFATSKDGTRIPIFLTHRKDISLDGDNRTLLYGYGGFNISLTPAFSVGAAIWLEHGGIYAVANLRGGGEYGEAWHQAGYLDRKQNVFDDFIAAAEYLIAERYTRPGRLAIQGGSNGGLLVATCEIQRPDLFGAVLCQVPVTDMLRYHRFTIFGSTTGKYWIPEYGDPDSSPDVFRVLRSYSPLHNATPAEYPATLIMTADHDDRVHPANSFKFAAALQAAQLRPQPILLRVETKAGHGAGKPTGKIIEEQADAFAFLLRALG
jgi:prolyl oligopeptidase